jgi:hypothetical protein
MPKKADGSANRRKLPKEQIREFMIKATHEARVMIEEARAKAEEEKRQKALSKGKHRAAETDEGQEIPVLMKRLSLDSDVPDPITGENIPSPTSRSSRSDSRSRSRSRSRSGSRSRSALNTPSALTRPVRLKRSASRLPKQIVSVEIAPPRRKSSRFGPSRDEDVLSQANEAVLRAAEAVAKAKAKADTFSPVGSRATPKLTPPAPPSLKRSKSTGAGAAAIGRLNALSPEEFREDMVTWRMVVDVWRDGWDDWKKGLEGWVSRNNDWRKKAEAELEASRKWREAAEAELNRNMKWRMDAEAQLKQLNKLMEGMNIAESE